ncbi:hypothetical protein GSI_05537 [Ganoderma sinense ZZ0214-1]|uniref:Uncharacterized protein n=1 Tax=Ganoderma sinense ZZ0214-1 TaxID=1077348 RepID=A0A2G8SEU3_9APHY|nr:hypothetical protein GSI_05537 [Ganoderma sinense ZZ0214-1]
MDHVRFLHEINRSISQPLSDSVASRSASLVVLFDILSSELSKMEEFRQDAWNQQFSNFHPPETVSSGHQIQYVVEPPLNDRAVTSPIPFTARFLVVVLNSVFKLSFKGCRLLLQSLRIIVRLAHANFSQDPRSSTLEAVLKEIPSDPATARKWFPFDPHSIQYACCPTCCALYPPGDYSSSPPPDPDTDDEDPLAPPSTFQILPNYPYDPVPLSHLAEPLRYPEQCTFKGNSESSPCGARLLRFGENPRPIRVFSYQTFVSWLARFLCRADIEPLLDASQARAGLSRDESVDDILSSPEVLNFLGPDGLPFLRVCGSDGRYLLGLFVDWFHPRGNRQGGAAYSAGVIFMVCLNLPPTLRYKRENIYLAGVIPGPKAPSLEEVNHFIEPLALEFRDLWFKGAHFSRTALRREGRLALCAIIPFISDLGAGRKVSGHASHSSTFFCSFCQLPKDMIDNLDMASWPRRTCQEFRNLAEEWRAAADRNTRDTLFKKSGVRYSPLLLLPYWQPTRYVVIDTMHNLFLGLFQHHCRRIFGMNVRVPSENRADADEPDPVTPEELEMVRLAAARCTTAASLKNKFNLRLLRPVYVELGLGDPEMKTKMQLADAIFNVRA